MEWVEDPEEEKYIISSNVKIKRRMRENEEEERYRE